MFPSLPFRQGHAEFQIVDNKPLISPLGSITIEANQV